MFDTDSTAACFYRAWSFTYTWRGPNVVPPPNFMPPKVINAKTIATYFRQVWLVVKMEKKRQLMLRSVTITSSKPFRTRRRKIVFEQDYLM